MSFAYKRISSLCSSHDPSVCMAEIACRSSTQTRNTYFDPIRVRRSGKSYLSGAKVVINGRVKDSLLLKYIHLSPLGSLPALHVWRHLVAKVETTKKLPRLQRVISITFSDWTSLHAEPLKVLFSRN